MRRGGRRRGIRRSWRMRRWRCSASRVRRTRAFAARFASHTRADTLSRTEGISRSTNSSSEKSSSQSSPMRRCERDLILSRRFDSAKLASYGSCKFASLQEDLFIPDVAHFLPFPPTRTDPPLPAVGTRRGRLSPRRRSHDSRNLAAVFPLKYPSSTPSSLHPLRSLCLRFRREASPLLPP